MKGGNRFLISITVVGSAGPIRFVVNEGELVASVIVTALKSYAREGWLPILESDLNDFGLYCTVSGTEALNPWDSIGSFGARNFILFKKSLKDKSLTEEENQITPKNGNNQVGSPGSVTKPLNLKASSWLIDISRGMAIFASNIICFL